MVRRVQQNETFHGTAAGQAPNFTDLEERFGLSERQAQCAALLRMGSRAQGVAEVLGISVSTLEKHLADLRRVFAVADTEELRSALRELIPDADLGAFHCWPAQTNSVTGEFAADPVFQARLRTSMSVEESLAALRDRLSSLGVRHLYYCFLPHSVRGFLRGDSVEVFLAPPAIEAAFQENEGLLGQPLGEALFNAPTSVPLVSLDSHIAADSLGDFYRCCLKHGASHMMVLGFPAGPGFVGMALTLAAPQEDPVPEVERQAKAIRSCAMAMHAAILTNGTLAARVRLTVRERDALSALGTRGACRQCGGRHENQRARFCKACGVRAQKA